ncbi:dihydroxy-acid dehydratase domain-containing protein [Bradyrhizobium sp. AZCC 2230]|uniref:dihydroxy-acid dehydratase domain-containing protein n=1 Tax=Bradyrhizobium sp. AZCC 2230 TaxID=3117021 RepID=UPI002FF418E6
MASLSEAPGVLLPGTVIIPAVHAERLRAAEATGAAAMNLLRAGIRIGDIITEKSIENAIRVLRRPSCY